MQHIFLCFLHVEEAGTFRKPLSRSEEQRCFEQMSQGDKEAKNKLILHNMRLVAHIIKKYYAAGGDQDDLISIGTVGLIKAVSTFDYSKGIRFATYASRCIENEILMSFRANKKQSDTVYMGDPIETDKDGNQLTLMDLIDDGSNLDELIDRRMQARQLYQYMSELEEPREKEILIARYGLYGTVPLTQREIAKKMGISRSYVSRLEKRALNALRKRYQ
ncbi:MAG: RNA polymerase sporulation sigma factor SigK [Ruminococcus sp.]|nr:RNA polymerase sporulation sigma factor SigK [Ruminococcus sp.]